MLRHLTLSAMLMALLTSAGCDDLKIRVENAEVRHHNKAKAWLIYKKKDDWKDVPTDHQNTVKWSSNRDGQIGTGIVMERDDLSIGTHQLSISGELKNPKNNKMEKADPKNNGEITLTVRNTKPTVSVLSPGNSAEFGLGQSIDFRVSADDAGEDGPLSGASIVWTSNQPPYNLGTGTSISRSDLDGSSERTLHVITVKATDSGGATQTETLLVTILNKAPEVTISEPATAKTIKVMQTLKLVGSAIDQDAPGGAASVPADRLSWSSNRDGHLGNGTTLSRSDLSGGVHTITLRARDASGVTGSASVQVEVINQMPIVAMSQPTKNQYSVTDSIQFAVSASDPDGAPIDPNKVVWSSSRDGQLGVGLTLPGRSLSGGVHEISVTVTDAHGGVQTAAKSVEVVNLKPLVSLDSPRNNDRFSVKDGVRFRVTTSDPDGLPISESSVRWTANGHEIGRGTSLTRTLEPGTHTVAVSVTDAHGGTSVDDVVIHVTNSAPTAKIERPTPNSFVSASDTVQFRADVRDADDNVRENDIVWTSDKDGELHRGASFSSDKLSPGQHELTLTVRDAYNETAFDTTRILVTNQDPTAEIRRPQQGAEFRHGQTIELRARGTDAEDGILPDSAFTWELVKLGQGHGPGGFGPGHHGPGGFGPGHGGPGHHGGPDYTGQSERIDVARLLKRQGAGNYMLILTVTDSDGAKATDRQRFRVLNDAPTQVKVFASATEITEGDSITFTGSAMDPETGLLANDKLVWSARPQAGGQPIALGQGSSLATTTLTAGTYAIFMVAVDPHDDELKTESQPLILVVKAKPVAPQPTTSGPAAGQPAAGGDQPASGAADAVNSTTNGGHQGGHHGGHHGNQPGGAN